MIRPFYFLLGIAFTIPPVFRFFNGAPASLWGQPVSALGDIGCFLLGLLIIYMAVKKKSDRKPASETEDIYDK